MELEKMTAMKKASLGLLIEEARQKLNDLWDRLKYGKEQMGVFQAYSSNECTDEVLEIHEREILRLDQEYDSLQEIFNLLDKRQEFLLEVEEVQNLAKDPNRFKSRDACRILRREEDARNIKIKKLPKLEAKLVQLIQVWEDERGKVLRVMDRRLMDDLRTELAAEDLKRKQEQKEKEDILRQRKEARQIQQSHSPTRPLFNINRTPANNKRTASNNNNNYLAMTQQIPSSNRKTPATGGNNKSQNRMLQRGDSFSSTPSSSAARDLKRTFKF
jgi:protein regulator of cytokinesis 1